MSKGKKVKPLPTPNLNQPLSLKLIGETIKERRTQQMLDSKTTAMLCGVSLVTLSKIEKGSPGVRMDSILKVMSGLGIHMSIEPWEDNV